MRKIGAGIIPLICVFVCAFWLCSNHVFAADGTAVMGGETSAQSYQTKQLSEAELQQNTLDLVNTVLSSPYSMEIFMWDTPENGYQAVALCYNGYQELESRTDAGSVLLELYLSESTQSWELTQEEDICAHFRLDVIEILLSQPIYYEKLNQQERKILAETVCAAAELDSSGMYALATVEEESIYQRAEDLKTLGGESVACYATDYEYTLAAIAHYNGQMTQAYPDIVKLGDPSLKYNCHSYAWYLQSVYNLRWIDNVDAETYMDDDHTHSVNAENVTVGCKVVYTTSQWRAAHSAIVVRIEADGTVICVSKWGSMGLYEHALDDVPDSYLNNGVPDVSYYRYDTAHTLTIRSSTATSHTGICTVCAQTITEVHTLDAATNSCAICGYLNPPAINSLREDPYYIYE